MSGDLAALFHDSPTVRVAANAALFRAGERVSAMYRIEQGAVVLTRFTGEGTPVVLQRAGPGQVVAEASAYATAYHCDAHVAIAATLRAAPLAGFRRRLAEDAALADAWAAHLARAVQAARLQAEIRTLRSVADRLEAWLASGGSLPAKGQWQGLAAELGVTREALYREFARRRRAAR